jgi:hypothetical protein
MPSPKRQPPTGAPSPSARIRQVIGAWERWETAAHNWKGLDDRLKAKIDLKNITRTKTSYQVRIHRGGKKVCDRSVAGHSEESLLKALQIRDEELQRLPAPGGRRNTIPARVLKALGLTEPVPGIYRLQSRSVYRVYYGKEGRKCLTQFYYRVVPEEVAYAAAIDFVEKQLHEKGS